MWEWGCQPQEIEYLENISTMKKRMVAECVDGLKASSKNTFALKMWIFDSDNSQLKFHEMFRVQAGSTRLTSRGNEAAMYWNKIYVKLADLRIFETNRWKTLKLQMSIAFSWKIELYHISHTHRFFQMPANFIGAEIFFTREWCFIIYSHRKWREREREKKKAKEKGEIAK